MVRNITLAIILALFLSGTTNASGFQINEHGAKAMSLGGAFTAWANDASAVQFNPAALVYLTGTKISLGSTYISPSGSFVGPNGALKTTSDLKNKYFTPINFYITHKINDKMAVGFGVNNPYGLGTEWEDNWVGRYNAIKTEVRVFNFTPVFSYKFSDKFSVGIGANIAYADVEITRALPAALTPPLVPALTLLPDGGIDLKGNDLTYGFNVSMMFKPNDQWSFGASYKHELAFDFDGDVEITFPVLPSFIPDALKPTVLAGLAAAYPPAGKATAPLTAPSVLSVGTAYKASDKFTASFDFQYTMWSSYDNLTINFANGLKATSVRDYQDSFILRFGAEYIVNDKFALRGGFLFDQNPIKDERIDFTLPDNDRYGFNLGFGYSFNETISLDVAYMLLVFPERTITTSKETLSNPFVAPTPLNGTYNPSASLIGANISFNL